MQDIQTCTTATVGLGAATITTSAVPCGGDAGEPLVSVVLPTYDRPDYLAVAMSSAVAQTHHQLEILVCDNASGVETTQVIRSFSDPRVRHLRNETNLGMTLNALNGYRAARGKYIGTLHDDDAWQPDFVAKLVAGLEAHPNAVIAFSDHYLIDAAGKIKRRDTKRNTRRWGRHKLAAGLHQPFHRLALIHNSVPMAMATLVRKAAVNWDDFPTGIRAYDYWLTYLACRDGGAAFYLPERLTCYRTHPKMATVCNSRYVDTGLLECYQRFLRDDRLREIWPALHRMAATEHTRLGVTCMLEGQSAQARQHFRTGLSAPGIKPVIGQLLSLLPNAVALPILHCLLSCLHAFRLPPRHNG